MLVKFKSDYQKITMGLLSYVPDLKDTTRLQQELDWYAQEENRQLYLWKSEETKDMAGVIGVEENDDLILLRHISLNPSYRHEGMTYEMLDALQEKYAPKSIAGTIETGGIITKWQVRSQEKEKN